MDQTNPAPQAAPQAPKKEGGTSSAVAIIVIIALVVLGGIYFLITTQPALQSDSMPILEEVTTSSDPDVQATMSQGTSDEFADIDADLSATDLSGIDTEIDGLGL